MKCKKLVLFFLGVTCVSGYSQINSMRSRVENLVDEVLPACEAKNDMDCIQREVQTLAAQCTAKQDWLSLYDVLSEYDFYLDGFNKYQEVVQNLREMDATLAQHKTAIGEEFLSCWVDCQIRWGMYYYKLQDYPNSFDRYQKLEKHFADIKQPSEADFAELGYIYRSMGGIHKVNGQYELAERYYRKVLDIESNRTDIAERLRTTAITHKRLGDVFLLSQDAVAARKQYQQALALYQQANTQKRQIRNGIVTTCLGMAKLEKQIGQNQQALDWIKRAEALNIEETGISFDVAYAKGDCLEAMHQYKEAKAAYAVTLQYAKDVFGDPSPHVSETRVALGRLSLAEKQPDAAIRHCQQVIEHYSSLTRTGSVSASAIRNLHILLDAHHQQALAYLMQYQNTKNGNHWEKAWESITLALQYATTSTAPGTSVEDKLIHQKNANTLVEVMLQIVSEQPNNPQHLIAAFQWMEKYRASVLLQAYESRTAQTDQNRSVTASIENLIPGHLVTQEKQIVQSIKNIQDSLLWSAPGRAKYWQNQLLQQQVKQRDLVEKIRTQYPDYYRIAYQTTDVSVLDFQKSLAKDQSTCLAYFMGQQKNYVFVLTPESIKLHKIADAPITEWTTHLHTLLLSGQSQLTQDQQTHQLDAVQYTQISYQLYNTLLNPYIRGQTHRLIVIPDGVLWNIPFDALLTKPVNAGQAANYKQHPYLLRNHTINLAFSAGTYLEMKKLKSARLSFLGVAPSFDDEEPLFASVRGASFAPLLYAQKEVSSIASLFSRQKIMNGKQATKSNFLQRASQYSVIHIASHAMADKSPFIAFQKRDTDTEQNYLLQLEEMYNLSLQANLVVLSACQTGAGILQKGEGVLSMGRGFALAGAKSVVYSMWPIQDESSANIMHLFYQHVMQKNPIDAALRQGKLDYLGQQKNHLLAHPYYWAAFSPVGDANALHSKSFPYKAWGFAVFTLLFGVGLWVWRKR